MYGRSEYERSEYACVDVNWDYKSVGLNIHQQISQDWL